MIVGYTATRDGLSLKQEARLFDELVERFTPGSEFHHGDCVGGDAHGAALAYGIGYRIFVHPPKNPKYRAFTDFPGQTVFPVADYLVRDRHIASGSDEMLGCPAQFKMLMRGSGTWYTVRYAANRDIPGLVIYPDGTVDNLGKFGYLGQVG